MKTIISLAKKPTYFMIGFFVSVFSFVLFSVVPHLREFSGSMALDKSLGADGEIMWQALFAMLKHTIHPTLLPTLLLSILTGLVVMLLVSYYRERGGMLIKTSGTGTLGLVLGILGIGCSACGTLALTAVLGTVGLGGVVLLLPYRGAEFLYIGACVLLFSVWQLVRLINKPLTCE